MTRQQLQKKLDLLMHEQSAYARGFKRVVGVDEAGRGPLAGPVVAAACYIPPGLEFPGINDSKLLTELKRQRFFEELTTHPEIDYSVSVVEASIIDKINIFEATKKAMKKALRGLKQIPDFLLIDAVKLRYKRIPFESLIEGDRRSQSIAAASILAKVTRDGIMTKYGAKYPKYGFESHKGYGTREHLAALAEFGATRIHRKSFAPVACVLAENEIKEL